MTMFLMNTVSAEVEPAGPLKNWFQLTGHKILRENYPEASEVLNEFRDQGALVLGAKLVGVHDQDDEIERDDPRFNNPEEPGFGVVQLGDGTYRMYLAVNQAEYALFRFLVRNEGGEEADVQFDPISNYQKPQQ